MSAEEQLAKLKEFALSTTPAVQNSIIFDSYLQICRQLYQLIVQYRTENNLTSMYIFSIRFISLVTELAQHNAANEVSNKVQLRSLQNRAQTLVSEIQSIVRPSLLKQLQEDAELQVLQNANLPHPHPNSIISPTLSNSSYSNPSSTIGLVNYSASTYPVKPSATSLPIANTKFTVPVASSTSSSSTSSSSVSSATATHAHSSSSVPFPSISPTLYPSVTNNTPSRTNGGSTSSASLYPSLHSIHTSASTGPSSSTISASASSSTLPHSSYKDLRNILYQPNFTTVPTSLSTASHPLPSAPMSTTVLRSLHVPAILLQTFLQIAQPNTSCPPRGIETCGVLCGKVYNDKLIITHLIIPKQKGSEDNCEMLAEEELFDTTTARGIVTIGWIHTHPSQDCFMSSMDLHTHVSYQLLLPEAIAIVMAPNATQGNRYAAFRLTDGGLEVIQACELRGFHPHDQDWLLYENSGHITWDKPQGPMYTTMNNSNNNYGSGNVSTPVQLQVIDLRNQ